MEEEEEGRERGRERNKCSTRDGKSGRKHHDKKRKTESGRKREVVGVGGYQGQEKLRSPTPAVPSQGSGAVGGQYLAGFSLQQLQLKCSRELPER